MQSIEIEFNIIYKPMSENLAEIFLRYGPSYAELIIPSLTNEITKSLIVRYSHSF